MTNENDNQPAPSTQIVEFSKTEAALADLRSRFVGLVFDVTTTKGMDEAKAARAEVRGYRTSLEHTRVDVKASALERCRLIDAEAKRITAALTELEEPIDSQIKLQEAKKEREKQERVEAEERRVKGILDRIAGIRSTAQAVPLMGATAAAKIADLIAGLEALAIDESFAEFRQQAEDAKGATLGTLRQFHAAAVDREKEAERVKAERAELDRLRAEAAARDAADRARRDEEERKAREAREAEEAKARAEREQRERDERAAREEQERVARAAREEQARIERERLAEQRRQQEAEQARIDAENKRIADERAELERQQAEQRRKEEEAEQQRKAAAEAEQKRKDAAARAAKRAKFPGEQAIVDALAAHFNVPVEVVMKWLLELRKAA